MKKQTKLIFGALIALLVIGLAFRPQRKSQSVPARPTGAARPPPVAASAPAQLQPVAARFQPAAPVNAPPGTPGQFATLRARERNAILDEIGKQDLLSIFQMWIEAGRVEHDLMKQGAVATTLGTALRYKPPSAAAYGQIQKFIADSSNSNYERDQLLGALGQAATKESLDLLIQTATTFSDPELKQVTMTEIRAAGDIWGDGTFHEELSPALERVWQDSQDQDLLTSTAVAMAKVGAPSGIKLLFASALAAGPPNDVRARVAKGVLTQTTILNPHAIPPLVAQFANRPPTSAACKLATDTLAAMGTTEATQVLIAWLETADASAASLAREYVVRTQTPTLWQAAVDPSVPFRSEQNREAIRAGLAQYKANRKVGQ